MSPFEDIDHLLSQLTLAEKVTLLSGIGACSTAAIERLSIPHLQTSDGPHGLRGGGGTFFNPPPGYQLPCATAMGATFDKRLMRQVGILMGDEGLRKRVHVALAPTVCIQRSPLIGRGFEAYAEDPVLSGRLAAEVINGLQSRKVGACVKHYAAHDQSTDSKEDDVVMTMRTLREIHLLPFQIATADSKPWAFMSAYQMINGVHVSEDPFMLQSVLRDEWKYDGIVISDWWGTYSTSAAINAGMDLEMPGPSVWRGKQLLEAVNCRKVSMQTINKSVKRLLEIIKRTDAHKTVNVPRGVGEDTQESRALVRRVAADSIVLLKNDEKILPLKADTSVKYGLIGEHFETPATCGGGSSETKPFYVSNPLEAMAEILGADNIRYEPGCDTCRWTPLISAGLYQPGTEKPGLVIEWFGQDPTQIESTLCLNSTTTTSTSMYFSQLKIDHVPDAYFVRARTTFVAPQTCDFRFALSARGRAYLKVDGKVVISLWEDHPEKTDDTPCFNTLSAERCAVIPVEKGRSYDLDILLSNTPPNGTPSAGGVRLGGKPVRDEDEAIEAAVKLAKDVDIPIILTGMSSDFEYEASDRKHLLLPKRENEMITRVCEANPKTVVIIQSGMPIQMPWFSKVSTLVHAWLGGQETGNAIADILFGRVSPSGRLSVTFPEKIEDTPAFLNFGKTDYRIVYGEGVFVGYRFYEKMNRPAMFAFGHGLSYTSFTYSNLRVPCSFEPKQDHIMEISVEVTNNGPCDGAEVIQVYICDLACSVQRPLRELKAFDKVFLKKGEQKTCSLSLDKYALSFWSEEHGQWKAEAGDFAVILGRSADPKDEIMRKAFVLEQDFLWSGV